ncbi:uncharacterized protein LOC130902740 [Diorhabda carinulata]|uniref:uncharacterized protein LOC130902740 n=1 Tax=Diorhabda carinulata TaxID=1163345 RepID=UPI0025A05B47|nr:uncharacterized protein LOC130902740 [Diorhabda carinulata]
MTKGSILLFALLMTVVSSEDVRLLDLDPPEAQQQIESHDQSLHYAPKIDSNVPAVRYIGNQPQQVLEDIYLARQYHGQDGLGGYLYGYNIPDIAKTEKKVAGGDLTGAYNYKADTGDEIKVQYWDDGTGFHQVDNVGDILKSKQVQDTPEVQSEKEKFFARWNEEAIRNQIPVSEPVKPEYQGVYQHNQQPARNYQSSGTSYSQGTPNRIDYDGAYSENRNSYSNPARVDQYQQNYDSSGQYDEKSEENGPPKGFFYNFEYPVGKIVQKEGTVGDLHDIYSANKNKYEGQLNAAYHQ